MMREKRRLSVIELSRKVFKQVKDYIKQYKICSIFVLKMSR